MRIQLENRPTDWREDKGAAFQEFHDEMVRRARFDILRTQAVIDRYGWNSMRQAKLDDQEEHLRTLEAITAN